MAPVKVATVAALLFAPALGALSAAEVPVRFEEGVIHGFLVLRTVAGVQVAQGDLFQPVWRIELTSPRWPE